ncbi:hypothetical protein AMS68_005952 [Peltaster fructicola]|uniref:CFEM domain-containing protein n=1 Tax=Peltaster fructicola TaxID=286661 RepID=A0A6H0Y0K0_9PEZI|nr:hypothetical protein AMS68_005952 [Peltaster fructicola]
MYGFKIASIAFLATTVLADSLPTCAQSCVTNYNGCSQFDVACICGSSAWIQGLACCVSKVCSADDQQATINYANTICAGVGITNLPQTASCASGASTSFSTGAATISVASSITAQQSTTNTASTTSASASGSNVVSGGSTTSVQGTTTTSVASAANSAGTTTRSGAASMQTVGAIGLGALFAGLVAAV